MKKDDRGALPSWLFKPQKVQTLSSSTVASFSPESGVKSNKGFQSLMLRTPNHAKDQTFTLLINDSTLAHELANSAVYSAKVIEYLLTYKCKPKPKRSEIEFDDNNMPLEKPRGEPGFNIYIIQDGNAVLLESTEKMSEGDFINNAEQAKGQFIALTSIPADDIVILDYAKMHELRLALFEIDSTPHIPQLICDQWIATQTLPEGQGLPAVPLTVDLEKQLGKQGMQALLASKFTFIVNNMQIEPGQTPHHQVEKLSWVHKSNTARKICMPALKHLSIESDAIVDVSPLKDIVQSSAALEVIELCGDDLSTLEVNFNVGKYSLAGREIEIIRSTAYVKKVVIDSYQITSENLQAMLERSCISELIIKNSLISDSADVINAILNNKTIKAITLHQNTYTGTKENREALSSEHLETLSLDTQADTLAFEPFLKTLRDIKTLRCVWSNDIDPMLLTKASLSKLINFNISDSELKEKTLEIILRSVPATEILTLNNIKISPPNENTDEQYHWEDIPLNNVKILKAISKTSDETSLKISIIGHLLSTMNLIEELDLSTNKPTEDQFDFEWTNHSFAHLKRIKLTYRPWNKNLISRIVKEATHLQFIDLSHSSKSDIGALAESDITLDHLEYLALCFNEFSSEDLSQILIKTSRLKSLNISECVMKDSSYFHDGPTSIVDINLNTIEIDEDDISNLFFDLSPISVKLNSIHNPPRSFDTVNEIIREIHNSAQIITLETSYTTSSLINNLFMFKNLRKLSVYHPAKLRSEASEAEFRISEIIIASNRFSQHDLHAFIRTFKHLKKLTLPDRCIDSESNQIIDMKALVSFIEKGTFIFKNQLITSVLRGKSIMEIQAIVPQREPDSEPQSHAIISSAEAGVVYDGDQVPALNLDPLAAKPTYQVKPHFKLVSGPDLNIAHVRTQVYFPDYETDKYTILKKTIPHTLKPYTITQCSRSHFSVYRKPSYEAVFNDPIPDLGLKDPWIELADLSPHDQLLTCRTSLDKSIDIKHCEVYGKYYVTLKAGHKKPQTIHIEYEVAPEFHSTHQLPKRIKDEIKKYSRQFQSNAPDSFKHLSLKEKLINVYEQPQHHACESRTLSFGYLIEYTNTVEQSFQVRIIKSCTHSWCEIFYKGNWHTIDLGGAPATIAYENNVSNSSTQSQNKSSHSNNNNVPLNMNLGSPQTPEAPPPNAEPNHSASASEMIPIARFEDLAEQLNYWSLNDNILIICKQDPERRHVNKVRRFLRSLEPHSMMVDSYQQALSSKPYIKLDYQNQTWEPIHPTGPAGWMHNQLMALSDKKSRIIIDWSSMENSQITKLNACIDIRHRYIDGVPIHNDTQVIGLICEDSPLLKDQSFLSRHRHRLYRMNDQELILDPPTNDYQVLTIELYHSMQWQTLMLGELGFDDEGNPIYHQSNLFNTLSPLHLIINNPPEDCIAFTRFIHDLQDGRSFHYADKSFTLPPMMVTLTHGYPFDVLKKSIMHLNTNISPEDLKTLSIDHTITPSTFERYLQTRSISSNKLMTKPGWMAAAKPDKPLSLYITRTLSEQQYCFLLKSAPPKSLNIYCAPGVELPKGILSCQPALPSSPHSHEESEFTGEASIFDISECTPDDLLYRFDYDHDKLHNQFTFHEKISSIWKKLEAGDNIILTGLFSDELMDHLATLLLPTPYLWHDGQKKTFKGKLIIRPINQEAPRPSYLKPFLIKREMHRKTAVLHNLKTHPIVCIEGNPGIGKSCFIRDMKADPLLNCFSFDINDKTSLKAWASSQDSRPTLLFIDEVDKLGTDLSMLKGINNPKREILIDGDIFTLSDRHAIVLIGNHAKQLPSLINEKTPRLEFNTLTKVYVITHILTPIFAEINQDTAEINAKALYNAHLTVREMQAEAIIICSKIKMQRLAQNASPVTTIANIEVDQRYHLTATRKPLFNALLDSLHARQFMQQAQADSARYGGQTGHMLQGLPGIGKSDIVHAAMRATNISKVTDLSNLYLVNQDHQHVYYHIGATCNIGALRKHLRQAFDQGCIVLIDELDALLRPDTPEDEVEVTRLIAELNAYLMGEDTQHNRPQKPGFMLLGTGNGISYYGRAQVPSSLASRLHMHKVEPYTHSDCVSILGEKFPALLNNARLNECIHKHVLNPQLYTFRSLLTDAENLNTFVTHAQQNHMPSAAGPSNTGKVNYLIRQFNERSTPVTPQKTGLKSAHTVKSFL